MGVDELLAASSGRAATVYECADGSVSYLAPDADDFCEAGEMKDDDLAVVQQILDEMGWRVNFRPDTPVGVYSVSIAATRGILEDAIGDNPGPLRRFNGDGLPEYACSA